MMFGKMRSVGGKMIAWGLAAAMTVSLTACGSGSGGSMSAKAEDKNNLLFAGQNYDLGDVQGEPNYFVVAEDKVYFLSVEYEESDDDFAQQSATWIYSMNFDGSDVTKVCEPDLDNDEEYILDFMVDKDRNIYLFSAVRDQQAESAHCYLSKADQSGSITDHIDLAEATEIGPDAYVSGVYTDDKGNLLVMCDQAVYVLNSAYQKVATIRNDKGWLGALAKMPDGTIVCGCSADDGVTVKILDVDAGRFGDSVKLDLPYFSGSDAMSNGCGDYDFFYNSDNGLFGYSWKTKTATQIVDYMASGIKSENSYGIVPIDQQTLIGTTWDSSGAKLTRYTKMEPTQIGDKTVITYGALWGIFDEVRDAAIKFNKENDKYQIEFVDYSENEEAQTKMIADILAGDGPDILDLSYVPIEPYAGKGILEDLTPYLEKDEELSKDSLVASAEKAMETDGKLYYVSSGFNVKTLLASKKDVGDKTGWTFDELKELLAEKGEGVRPFYSENKEDTLINFLYSSINDYIDWDKGECSFNSDEFKSMLEIADRGTNEETDYIEDSQLVKEGKVLFFEGYANTQMLQEYKQMCGSDINFIGYPSADRNGSYFSFNNQIGIYSKSKVKDGAWEFVRTFLTKEYQAGDGYMFSNPTNREAFEMYMKSLTATKAYKDEFGHRITPVDESWAAGDGRVKIGPLPPEDEKIYRDLINNTTKVVTFDDSILDIIREEATDYFEGRRSLDETADIIQNRITTYVNEKR